MPEGKRGRGNKGDGLKAYAEKIGKHRPSVSMYRDAGEVVLNVSIDRHLFIANATHASKAQHLSAIHKLPQEAWQVACEWLGGSSCSLSDCNLLCQHNKLRGYADE